MRYAECGEDLMKGDERSGRLLTGDMAQFDEDGYYYIVGRKKRFLKVYGNRVNLDEIDTMVKMEFNNLECASGGVDDHVYIFVTEKEKEEEILDFLAGKTSKPPFTYVLPALPPISTPNTESRKAFAVFSFTLPANIKSVIAVSSIPA